MKKQSIAVALVLLATPALAEEAKPAVWVMALQFKGSTMTVNYPTEAVCNAAAKASTVRMKKLGIGRADCIPVAQP